MGSRLAFVLNFDAELELEAPDTHRPSPRLCGEMRSLEGRLIPALRALADEVEILRRVDPEPLPDGAPWQGRAWCPTPQALSVLRAAGASVPAAPPLDVLQRVNHRAFCAALGQALPGARFVTTLDQLDAVLRARPPGSVWLLKRPFGFSGRARKRIAPGELAGAARTWASASMSQYGRGLQVEPWVDVAEEFAWHGSVAPDGALTLGRPTVQRCDADGRWLESRLALVGELHDDEHAALRTAVERVGAALLRAGYFGPFGIDGFRWSLPDGARGFQPLSEINARHSMGWFVGMALGPA